MNMLEDTDTIVTDRSVSVQTHFRELRERILSALRHNHGLMRAKDLIREVQDGGSNATSEDVRRAILELSAGGLTAYTSDWDVILKSSLQE